MTVSSYEDAMQLAIAPMIKGIEELCRQARADKRPNLELELRVGRMQDMGSRPRFVPGVSRDSFCALTEMLRSNSGWEHFAHIRQTDYYKDINGKNVRLTLDDVTGQDSLTVKTKLASRTFRIPGSAYDVRVSLASEEKPSEMTMEDFGDECQDSRGKERISYRHQNKYGMQWSFDATVVKPGPQEACEGEDPDEDPGDVIYEMELEVPWDQGDEARMGYMAVSTTLKLMDLLRVADPYLNITEQLTPC
jgi:hypothetical protein